MPPATSTGSLGTPHTQQLGSQHANCQASQTCHCQQSSPTARCLKARWCLTITTGACHLNDRFTRPQRQTAQRPTTQAQRQTPFKAPPRTTLSKHHQGALAASTAISHHPSLTAANLSTRSAVHACAAQPTSNNAQGVASMRKSTGWQPAM